MCIANKAIITATKLTAFRIKQIPSPKALIRRPATAGPTRRAPWNIEELRAVLKARDALDDIGVDAILIMPDILNHSLEGIDEIITKFAKKHTIPVGGCMSNTAEAGAIFSYFPDSINQGMLAAGSADKILRGMPAGTIPVITPENFLRINYRALTELGLTASESLLGMAEKIIR